MNREVDRSVANKAEEKDTELTSFHSNTKITTIYRANMHTSDLQTSRKDTV